MTSFYSGVFIVNFEQVNAGWVTKALVKVNTRFCFPDVINMLYLKIAKAFSNFFRLR